MQPCLESCKLANKFVCSLHYRLWCISFNLFCIYRSVLFFNYFFSDYIYHLCFSWIKESASFSFWSIFATIPNFWDYWSACEVGIKKLLLIYFADIDLTRLELESFQLAQGIPLSVLNEYTMYRGVLWTFFQSCPIFETNIYVFLLKLTTGLPGNRQTVLFLSPCHLILPILFYCFP